MIEDYARARKLGLRQRNQDLAAGRYPYVPAFDDLFARASEAGLSPVRLPALAALERGSDLAAVAAAAAGGDAPRTLEGLRAREAA